MSVFLNLKYQNLKREYIKLKEHLTLLEKENKALKKELCKTKKSKDF